MSPSVSRRQGTGCVSCRKRDWQGYPVSPLTLHLQKCLELLAHLPLTCQGLDIFLLILESTLEIIDIHFISILPDVPTLPSVHDFFPDFSSFCVILLCCHISLHRYLHLYAFGSFNVFLFKFFSMILTQRKSLSLQT